MAMAVVGATAPAPAPLPPLPDRHRLSAGACASARSRGGRPAVEIRVCTNRMCARQGGREVLAALGCLSPPRVDVASCGCLGRCGAGPNVAASIAGSAAIFGHVGTAARTAQLLEHLLGAAEFDAAAGLAAREKAEAALEKGDAAEAEALVTETIGLNARGGLPLVYRSRSKARVAIGDIAGALADDEEAIRIAPKLPLVSLHL